MSMVDTLLSLESHTETIAHEEDISPLTIGDSILEDQREGQRISQMLDEVGTAIIAAEGYLDMITSLEGILDTGGLDKNSVLLYKEASRNYRKALGLEETHYSLESFSSISSRHTNTYLSLESEKGTFRKVIDAIINFLKELYRRVKSYIIEIFNENKTLEKSINNLDKKVKEQKKVKLKTDVKFNLVSQVTVKEETKFRLGKSLLFNNSDSSSITVDELINTLKRNLDTIVGMKIPKTVEEITRNHLKDNPITSNPWDEIASNAGLIPDTNNKNLFPKEEIGNTYKYYKNIPLPGGYIFLLRTETSKEEAVFDANFLFTKVEEIVKPLPDEIFYLDEISSTATLNLVGLIRKQELLLKEVEKTINKIIAEWSGVRETFDNPEEDRKAALKYAKETKDNLDYIFRFVYALNSYNKRTIRDILMVIHLSLNS